MHRFRTASISCTRSTFSTSTSETQEPHAGPSRTSRPDLGRGRPSTRTRGWGGDDTGTGRAAKEPRGARAHLHCWRSRGCSAAGLGDGQGRADLWVQRIPQRGQGDGEPPRCRPAQAHQQRDPCSRRRAALRQVPPRPFREAGDRRSCRVKPCREHASPGEAPEVTGRGAGGRRPSPSACTAAARFTRWSASSMASAGPSGSSRESPMTRMRISVSSRMGTSEQRRRKKLRAEWAVAGS